MGNTSNTDVCTTEEVWVTYNLDSNIKHSEILSMEVLICSVLSYTLEVLRGTENQPFS